MIDGPAMKSLLTRSAPLLLLLLLLGATSGCTKKYWSKAGATPEQFTGDSQACVQQAATTLPAGAAVEAVEQFYRACLQGRGYVRDSQVQPPPPGSFRGLEDREEFSAAVQAAAARAPRLSFEQQLSQLDDLKARGRITEDEYATMRKRLVEGATPAALAPPAPAPVVAAAPSVAGRWYGRGGGILDIRTPDGRRLEWDWELLGGRTAMRAQGRGTVTGDRVSLTGYSTGTGVGVTGPFSFTLTHEGAVLRGVWQGPSNVPTNVELRRERP
jgi:hypothetical protein